MLNGIAVWQARDLNRMSKTDAGLRSKQSLIRAQIALLVSNSSASWTCYHFIWVTKGLANVWTRRGDIWRNLAINPHRSLGIMPSELSFAHPTAWKWYRHSEHPEVMTDHSTTWRSALKFSYVQQNGTDCHATAAELEESNPVLVPFRISPTGWLFVIITWWFRSSASIDLVRRRISIFFLPESW